MIINKMNIEGICNNDELKKLSFKESNIFNNSLDIKIRSQEGIKDIMEISIETNILSFKLLEFHDTNVSITTIEIKLNILAIENRECNTLSIIEERQYFNYSFKVKNKKATKEDVTLKVIDCYFKIVDEKNITGTLTYLIKENIEEILVDNEINKINKYKLIDVEKEFA